MKQMDEIIYYPSTRAILIQELKTALEMYEKHEMTNEQLRYLVEHYMKGFGHLMFERDYELHPRLNKLMGKGHYYVLEMVIRDIREEMAGKVKKMEAEEFIKIYEYLKNEHEEEMAERYEEIMDVQYGVKTILEELQEIKEALGLEKKELPF